jgi:CheY-like chemotaxis protein
VPRSRCGLALCEATARRESGEFAHPQREIALSAREPVRRGGALAAPRLLAPFPRPSAGGTSFAPPRVENSIEVSVEHVLRLLIVEDEVGLRRSLARYFALCGLEVTEAGSVGEAHEHLDAGVFDVVVLDVGLPDGDGLTLLPRTDARRSVVVTADPDPDRFRGVGVIRHLAKPLDLRELRTAVEAAARA